MKELRLIIVEDESGAADQLGILLRSLPEKVEILAILSGVEETVAWLRTNPRPDLGIFDIQLEDGLSLDIFKRHQVTFPVIFATAYDQYAIDAFKVNSIDYLLKPIKERDLRFSLNKYYEISKPSMDFDSITSILDSINLNQKVVTLLVHVKERLIPIQDREFAYFFLDNGTLWGCTRNNRTLPIHQTIDDLAASLNRNVFFQVNRQAIVNRVAIQEIEFYFNGRLLLKLSPPSKSPILISKARVPSFKEWLGSGST